MDNSAAFTRSIINNNNAGGSFGRSTFINNNNGFPDSQTFVNNNNMDGRFDTTFINNNQRPVVLTNRILASLPFGSLILTNDGQTIFIHKNTQLVIHLPNSAPSAVVPPSGSESVPLISVPLPANSVSDQSAVVANNKQEIKENTVSVSSVGDSDSQQHVSQIKKTEKIQEQSVQSVATSTSVPL